MYQTTHVRVGGCNVFSVITIFASMIKQELLQLTGGVGKERRRDLDFYSTPRECTVALMDFLELPICRVLVLWLR